MSDETKEKIQIRQRGSRSGGPRSSVGPKDVEELQQDVKKLKKQVGRLLNIAEHEESLIEEYQGKPITLKLVDGSEEVGTLKEITKFQIVIEQDGSDNHFYKSAVIKYHF